MGATHKILSTRARWLPAEVTCVGQQELLRIHVERHARKKEILAGADQVWFVYRTRDILQEVRSCELLPGQHLKSVWSTLASDRVPSPVAIMHGIVFGDGSHPRYQTRDWNPSCRVTLCGEKQELSGWFAGHSMTPVAVGLDVTGLPHYFKQMPNITESDSYLFGWLQGYFATDGSASGCISSVSKSNLIFARDVATRIGLPTYGIRESEQHGYTGVHTLYYLPFALAHLPEDFYLRAKHKAGLVFERNRRNLPRWRVVLVERTGIIQPAYRVQVKDSNSFSIEDNILTHGGALNICGGA
ncbi:MAG: LAGLIDADG family homing endonuclease [Verrucomicrobia bacterium]|nr:LAGLIDADG family homing endonuclease [Verrucomicrobiota bacterium]